MKFVVGDLIVKNNIFWVILGVLNSNFIVQNINTYTREEVKEDWFNGCKKAKEEKIILRTPYLCAKSYREKLLDFYKINKKFIKRKEIDYNSSILCIYNDTLSEGLRFCKYKEDSVDYKNYKGKIIKELRKVEESFRNEKKI